MKEAKNLTASFYEVGIKYDKINENGMVENSREQYVVNAESFTEAEMRITKEMAEYACGEFENVTSKRAAFREVILQAGAPTFFKAKVAYVTITESGKERQDNTNVLVQAESFAEAHAKMQNYISVAVSGDWRILEIKETSIQNIFMREDSDE